MHGTALDSQHPRGVFLARAKRDGFRVYYAVNSVGNHVRTVVIRPGVNEVAAVRWLEQLLDRLDPPRPKLRLLRAAESSRDPNLLPNGCYSTGEIVEDFTSYTLRRARQYAQQRPFYRLR